LSSSIQTVRVELDRRAYDIDIGTSLIESSGSSISRKCGLRHAVIITDTNVQRPHAVRIGESLADCDINVDVLTIDAGETSKSLETVEALWSALLESGADRRTVVIAVGGGVVGDVAGFVAACYARGLAFVQVPTTLLAQVDSSVGGKVGINLPEAKNMVGAFWQPQYVLIDTSVLETLPQREYRAGLAEVVKYGVILDGDFFSFLEGNVASINRRDDEVLQAIIARCCRLKADVVESDEREETGRRAVLNYGHTFGHALEAVTGYGQLLHGEAVSIGMLCAARLAASLGMIEAGLVARQSALLSALNLPIAVPDVDREAMIAAMRHDKKTQHGQLRFVLPTRLGYVELTDNVGPSLVRASLEQA
jgi:3-dehydroquinate synthase